TLPALLAAPLPRLHLPESSIRPSSRSSTPRSFATLLLRHQVQKPVCSRIGREPQPSQYRCQRGNQDTEVGLLLLLTQHLFKHDGPIHLGRKLSLAITPR